MLTLDTAVHDALERNLSLLAEQYNLSVAEARIIQARLRPNPVFTVSRRFADMNAPDSMCEELQVEGRVSAYV